MPGVALRGPQATGAWMHEFGAWYFDLARTWDGAFPHQGPPQKDNDSYRGWDASVGYLLAHAMPLRKLLLTGKQPNIAPQIDVSTAQALLSYGAHAKPFIPELRKTTYFFEKDEKNFPKHLMVQKANTVREAIRGIEAAEESPLSFASGDARIDERVEAHVFINFLANHRSPITDHFPTAGPIVPPSTSSTLIVR